MTLINFYSGSSLKEEINKPIICGLDVSSSVAGIAILQDNKIIDLMYYEFKGETDIDRTFEFKEEVFPYIKHCDHYVLEDRMMSFSGLTTAKTLFPLAHINASVQIIISIEKGKESIKKIHPSTARKRAYGIGKISKKQAKEMGYIKAGKIDTKMWVFDNIVKLYPNIPVDRKRTNRPRDYMFDMVDAIVLSLSYN